MRSILIVLALLLLAAMGLGFYQRWFSLSASHRQGKSTASVCMDQRRMTADRDTMVERVRNWGHSAVDAIVRQ